MKYGLTQTPIDNTSECLVFCIFSDTELSKAIHCLDKEHQDLISKLAKKATQAGDTLWQTDMQEHSVLLIQCGKKTDFNASMLQKRVADCVPLLIKQRIRSATLCFPLVASQTANKQLEQMILQLDNQLYQLLDFKTKNAKPHALESIQFYLPDATEHALIEAQAIASGVEFTRHLANQPANVCTPTYLGEQATLLASQFKQMSCTVMGPDEMRKMGMGSFLAVSQGSEQPPRLIDIHYQGGGKEAPIVIVGKGITFDSGGLSIKPANCMDEMKYDMCGAASVLGTLKACALLQLPINVVGIIASAENMLSGAAVKPGDIVTSMSGQTIEIINTDAEGRLVLADALTYAERYNPEFVLDIATLTGAMVVALGAVFTGFLTKDEELAARIEEAAKESEDKAWRMPLDDAYQEAIDSPLADMLNATFDRSAGAITAAAFLSRFTEKYRWAHLDIAGTAWVSGKKRNATGRPVPLLTQLVRNAANSR